MVLSNLHNNLFWFSLCAMLTLLVFFLSGCDTPLETITGPDQELERLIAEAGVTPLNIGEAQDPAKVALGEALFFDKILSGNQDISCATCHHPSLGTGDGLALPIGTGGTGLGAERVMGVDREFVPRNAPELFNRGVPEWDTMFWDGRIALDSESGRFVSPAGEMLPVGLDNVLAVQALFPPTSRDEMRGGLIDVSGYGNELAAIHDLGSAEEEMLAIWDGLTDRLLSIDGYRTLFAAAYPQVPLEEIGFHHAANAMAAFEIDAFSFTDAPWDRYLEGEQDALSAAQKEGAALFYGRAGCASCHSGSLMTDQAFHNIAVPQFGPGKLENGFDPGRYQQSNDFDDMCAFRTPPLRNVALTGPYMHNGAFADLEEAVRHHLDPEQSLNAFSVASLPGPLQITYQDSADSLALLTRNISPQLEVTMAADLTDAEIDSIVLFLESLTSPSVMAGLPVPQSVPSGLPVSD